MKVKSEREVAQPCPTLGDTMDCSPPGLFVYGIFQVRILQWGAIAFPDGLLEMPAILWGEPLTISAIVSEAKPPD